MIGSGRWRSVTSLGLVSALVLLAFVPALPLTAAAGSSPTTSSRGEVGPGFAAVVYWNGANVAGAGTPSSAITLGSYSQVTVRYFWNYSNSPAGFSMSDARLAMTYFGFALSTRDVTPIQGASASSGSFDMSWSAGAIEYVLSGMYRLTATLFSANGSTVWSEDFYVHLVPPFAIGAIVPLLLIVILVVELIAVARSGRQALLKSKPGTGAPPPPTGGPPPPPSGGPVPPPSGGEAPPAAPPSPPGGSA